MRLLPRWSAIWRWVRRHPILTGLAAGLCVALGAGAYVFDREARVRRHWHQAQDAIADYDFARAQAELGEYLKAHPESGEAHFLLARACRRARVEDFDGAQSHLAEARRLQWPEDEVAFEFRLLDFQSSGRADDRERRLRDLIGNPASDQRLVLEALARGCLRGERLEDAVAYLDRRVAAHPDDWYPYLCRGTVYQHMDRPAPAVADLDRVRRLRPDFPDIDYRLGLALVQSGSDFPRALKLLESWQKTHPDDVVTRVMSARCRSVLNERESARDILRSVLAAEPDQPEALLAAALVEIDLENFPEALRCLRRLEPQAGSPPVEEAFQKLLRLEPAPDSRSIPTRLQTVYHLLATVLRRTGPDAEADAYERKLLEHDTAVADLLVVAKEQARLPNDPEVWYKMGVLNLKVGMKDTGEYWLKRVLRAHPNDRRAHRALADFYRGRPDPESQFKADQHARLAGGVQ